MAICKIMKLATQMKSFFTTQLYFAIEKCRVLQRFLQSVAAKEFQLVRESALVKR